MFRRSIEKVRRDDPAELEAFIGALRARVDTLLEHPQKRVDMAQDLPVLKAYLPDDLWVKHFRPFMHIRAAVLEEDGGNGSSSLPWALTAVAGFVVALAGVVVVRHRRAGAPQGDRCRSNLTGEE